MKARFYILADTHEDSTLVDAALERFERDQPVPCDFNVEYMDMSAVPYAWYGNSLSVDTKYLKNLAKTTWNQHLKEYDYIVLMIGYERYRPAHQKRSIWGWAMHLKYPVLQVMINTKWEPRDEQIKHTAGTLWHEVRHIDDSFIYEETGENINKIPAKQWGDYDKEVVHGKSSQWRYMKYPGDNIEAVRIIKPLLEETFAKRRAHESKTKSVLRKLVDSFRHLVAAYTKKYKTYERQDT